MDRPMCLVKERRLNVVSGLQTQHREPIKNPDVLEMLKDMLWGSVKTRPVAKGNEIIKESASFMDGGRYTMADVLALAPYQVGDRWYLREPYQIEGTHAINPIVFGRFLDDDARFKVSLEPPEYKLWSKRKFPYRKTSGRFMYKSLARHWFEVTGVKAEQVQDISIEDCTAEGGPYGDARDWTWFRMLWDSCYNEGEYGWDKNPWNFAYKLRKVEK